MLDMRLESLVALLRNAIDRDNERNRDTPKFDTGKTCTTALAELAHQFATNNHKCVWHDSDNTEQRQGSHEHDQECICRSKQLQELDWTNKWHLIESKHAFYKKKKKKIKNAESKSNIKYQKL